jgi:hypothetical protein
MVNSTAAGVVTLAGGLCPVAEPSYRSARVQSELRRHWKETIKRQAPAVRERFLDSPEGRAALGAATCKQLLKAIRSQFESLAAGAAAAGWLDRWMFHGELPPGLEFDPRGRLKLKPDGRVHAARLVLGVRRVRNGVEHPAGTEPGALPIAGPASSRWTPPQAVELEDWIDLMEPNEAAKEAMEWPASPSAHVIQQIEIRRGREREGRWTGDRTVRI